MMMKSDVLRSNKQTNKVDLRIPGHSNTSLDQKRKKKQELLGLWSTVFCSGFLVLLLLQKSTAQTTYLPVNLVHSSCSRYHLFLIYLTWIREYLEGQYFPRLEEKEEERAARSLVHSFSQQASSCCRAKAHCRKNNTIIPSLHAALALWLPQLVVLLFVVPPAIPA